MKRTRWSGRNFRDNQAVLTILPGVQLRESRRTSGLIKIGARVVRHAKHATFQMDEVAVPRELFTVILEPIRRFGVPPALLQRE